MRIISGNYKGRKIFEPIDKETRPLKDLTKESIFNILEHSKNMKISLKESNVLDLFSGTGSFGLECISRGSSRVYFIEQHKPSIKVLTKNIKKLNCEKKIKLLCENVFDLKKIEKINKNKFNIIFLDPPYKEKNLKKILDNIFSEKLLNDNGVIIIHRHKNENDQFSENLKVIEEKKYGISKIIFVTLN